MRAIVGFNDVLGPARTFVALAHAEQGGIADPQSARLFLQPMITVVPSPFRKGTLKTSPRYAVPNNLLCTPDNPKPLPSTFLAPCRIYFVKTIKYTVHSSFSIPIPLSDTEIITLDF